MMNVSPPGHTLKLSQHGDGRFAFNLVCLRGYMEIVTLRRLDEHHSGNAMDLLFSGDGNVSLALHVGVAVTTVS